MTVNTSTFTANTATNGGAVYKASEANLTLDENQFAGNNATANGGAIYGSGKGNLTVTDSNTGNSAQSSFTNNVAVQNGGALYFDTAAADGKLVLQNTAVGSASNANRAKLGGGLYTAADSVLVNLNGMSFAGNNAVDGGAVYGAGSLTLLETGAAGSSLVGNTATGNGGALYAAKNVAMDAGNATLTFDQNTAQNGGAGYVVGDNASTAGNRVTKTKFTRNVAQNNGGALYTVGNKELTVVDSMFGDGAATGNGAVDGGAIYSTGALSISDTATSVFAYNTASGSGGAIYQSGGALNVGTSSAVGTNLVAMIGNRAANGGGLYLDMWDSGSNQPYTAALNRVRIAQNKAATGNGGGIYVKCGSLQVNSTPATANVSVVDQNKAALYGGGIYLEQAGMAAQAPELRVERTDITYNLGESGGGVYVPQGSRAELVNAGIKNNSAAVTSAGTAKGGGIYNEGTLAATDSVLNLNAADAGGGIYSTGNASFVTLLNCSMYGNLSNTNGGAVYSMDTNLMAVDCTVAGNASLGGNTTSGGVYLNTAANRPAAFLNCLVVGNKNTASNYSDLYLLGSEGALSFRQGVYGVYGANGVFDTTMANELANGIVQSDVTMEFNGTPTTDANGVIQIDTDARAAYSGVLTGYIGTVWYYHVPGDAKWRVYTTGAESGYTFVKADGVAYGLTGGTVLTYGLNKETGGGGNNVPRVDTTNTYSAYSAGAYALEIAQKHTKVDTKEDWLANPYTPTLSLREAVMTLKMGLVQFDSGVFPTGGAATNIIELKEQYGQIVLNAGQDTEINGGTGTTAPYITVKAPVTYAEQIADATGETQATQMRVFDITAGGNYTVMIKGLNILGGDVSALGEDGGAVRAQSPVSLVMDTVRIADAKAANGGGLAIDGCDAVLSAVTLTGNAAAANGGGLATQNNTIQVKNSSVYTNDAGGSGGGIYAPDGAALELVSSTVAGNHAAADGGGVYAGGDSMVMNTLAVGNYTGSNPSGADGRKDIYKADNTNGLQVLYSVYGGIDTAIAADPKLTVRGGYSYYDAAMRDADLEQGAPERAVSLVTVESEFGVSWAKDAAGKWELPLAIQNGVVRTNTGSYASGGGALLAQNNTDGTWILHPGGQASWLNPDGSVNSAFSNTPSGYTVVAGSQNNVPRTSVSTAYTAGAYAWTAVSETSVVVNTSKDEINPFDGLTSLREAASVRLAGSAVTFDANVFAYGGDFNTIVLQYNNGDGNVEIVPNRNITVTGLAVPAEKDAYDEPIGPAGAPYIWVKVPVTNQEDSGAASQSRVLNIGTGRTVGLKNLQLSGGAAAGNGGTLLMDGANVSLDNTFVFGSAAQNGGGIYANGATLNLMNSTVYGSAATAGNGGGIALNAGVAAEFVNSTIYGNGALGNGGGVYLGGNSLELISSTVAGNHANSGCGVYMQAAATANMINTIALGNYQSGTDTADDLVMLAGGAKTGWYNMLASGGVNGSFTNPATANQISTLAREFGVEWKNTTNQLVDALGGNPLNTQTGTLTVRASSKSMLYGTLAGKSDDIWYFNDWENSIVSQGDWVSASGAAGSAFDFADKANYGLTGGTVTVIDTAQNIDEDGTRVNRAQGDTGALYTAGAYALDYSDLRLIVDTDADRIINFDAEKIDTTLREAMELARRFNGTVEFDPRLVEQGKNVITVLPQDPDDLTPTGKLAPLEMRSSMKIKGLKDDNLMPAITITNNETDWRVFDIAPASASVDPITVSISDVVLLGKGGMVNDAAGNHNGGVLKAGDGNTKLVNLTLDNVVLQNGLAENGGGIYVDDGSKVLINRGVFYENATDGSGSGGAVYAAGNVDIVNSTLYGNSNTAVYSTDILHVVSSTLAANDGGGIQVASGQAQVVNSIAVGNTGGDDISGAARLVYTVYGTENGANLAEGNNASDVATEFNAELQGGRLYVIGTGDEVFTPAVGTIKLNTVSASGNDDDISKAALYGTLAAYTSNAGVVANDWHYRSMNGDGNWLNAVDGTAYSTYTAQNNYGLHTDDIAVYEGQNPNENKVLPGNNGDYESRVVVDFAYVGGAYVARYEDPSTIVTINADKVSLFDQETSLREALYYASHGYSGYNTPVATGDVPQVTFDSTVFYADGSNNTLQLVRQLETSSDTDVIGTLSGTNRLITIVANNASRVIETSGSGEISLQNLNLKGGTLASGDGAVAYAGGQGTLSFMNSVLSGGTAGNGGAVYAADTATVQFTQSTLSGNRAQQDGGAIYTENGAQAVLTGSSVTGNIADVNGGAVRAGGLLSVTDSTLKSNTAVNGGAISIVGDHASVVETTLLQGNNATGHGGAAAIESGGRLAVVNSTVFGNSAPVGGALYNEGNLVVADTTVSQNAGGGLANSGMGNASVAGSIVLGNTGTDLANTATLHVAYGVYGTQNGITTKKMAKATTNVANVFGTETPVLDNKNTVPIRIDGYGAYFGTLIGNIPSGVNAGWYYRDGGFWYMADGTVTTATYTTTAPAYGLEALDAAARVIHVGQNGNSRVEDINSMPSLEVFNAGAHALAVELEAPSNIADTTLDAVNPFDNKTSLREAVAYGITLDGTAGFAAALGGQTITLDEEYKAVQIDGDLVLSGDAANRITVKPPMTYKENANTATDSAVFDIANNTTVEINNLTVLGGKPASGAGGVNVGTGADVLLSDVKVADGHGGISSSGDLKLEDCEVSGNVNTNAVGGGGILTTAVASGLELENTSIKNNQAVYGGGIMAASPLVVGEGSTFEGNKAVKDGSNAGGEGGAVYSTSDVAAKDPAGTPFKNNTAANDGGAVYWAGGANANKLDIGYGNFTGNSAAGNGGAVFTDGQNNAMAEPAYLAYTTFTGNSATGNGGAVYNNSMATLVNATLYNNVAAQGGNAYNNGTLITSGVTVTGTAGSGVGTSASSATYLLNSVVTGNKTYDVSKGGGSTLKLVYSVYNVLDGAAAADIVGGRKALTGVFDTTVGTNGFDGTTVAIDKNGMAAYAGTFTGSVTNSPAVWYYVHNGNWVGLDGTPSAAIFVDDDTTHYGLDTLVVSGHADPVADAQNMDAGSHLSRVLTTEAYNAGAHALKLPDDPATEEGVVVTTSADAINPFDGLVSLREAVHNFDPLADTEITFDSAKVPDGKVNVDAQEGDLVIDKTLTLEDGFNISGDGTIAVDTGVEATFGDVTLAVELDGPGTYKFAGTTAGTATVDGANIEYSGAGTTRTVYGGDYADLMITGSGQKTLGGDVDVSGTFSMNGTNATPDYIALDGKGNTITLPTADYGNPAAPNANVTNTDLKDVDFGQTLYLNDTNTANKDSNVRIIVNTAPAAVADYTVEPITYGDTLADAQITADLPTARQQNVTGKYTFVDGTVMPDVGDSTARAIQFVPDNPVYIVNTPVQLGILVNPRELQVDVSINTKVFDGNKSAVAVWGALHNVLQQDINDVMYDASGIVATFNNANAGVDKPVSFAPGIIPLSGARSHNYILRVPTDAKGTILQAQVTVVEDPAAGDVAHKGATLGDIPIAPGKFTDINGKELSGTYEWTTPDKKLNKDGTYTICFTPDDKNYAPYEVRVPVTVVNTPLITSDVLPSGIEGLPYETKVEALGQKPIRFALVDGQLPDGLTLNPNGTISGQPIIPGTYTFTVRATNDAGIHEKKLRLTILEENYSFINDPDPIKNKDDSFTGIVDGSVSKFERLLIDGQEIPREYYSVESAGKGKVKITIFPSFLNQLANGKYLITAVFTDGAANYWMVIDRPVEPDYYTIKATYSKGGKLSSAGTIQVEPGSNYTVRFMPDKGYFVSAVWVDGRKIKTDGKSYTFVDIHSNHKIYVVFARTSAAGTGDASDDVWPYLLCMVGAVGAIGLIFWRCRKRQISQRGE